MSLPPSWPADNAPDPGGHVVIAFPSEDECDYASAALRASGFGEDDVRVGVPEPDVSDTDAASGTANNTFMVVRACDQKAVETVAEVASHCHAQWALYYGAAGTRDLIANVEPGGSPSASNDGAFDSDGNPSALRFGTISG